MADKSGGDIIVTMYTRMSRDIKMLIADRLTEKIRTLENRNRYNPYLTTKYDSHIDALQLLL